MHMYTACPTSHQLNSNPIYLHELKLGWHNTQRNVSRKKEHTNMLFLQNGTLSLKPLVTREQADLSDGREVSARRQ